MSDRLTPTSSTLWVVRWVRADGRDVKHRYFRRQSDAETFHAKLEGREAALFSTPTAWTRRDGGR
jgi:hypothetical protein